MLVALNNLLSKLKNFFNFSFKFEGNKTTMYYYRFDNLLISKILIFNSFIFSIFLYFLYSGNLFYIYNLDDTYITELIVILTFISMVISIYKGYVINSELKSMKMENKRDLLNKILHTNNISLQTERNRQGLEIALISRISLIKHVSRLLVVFGLIGTVIGFIIVFLYSKVEIGNVEAIKEILPVLLKGMGIALMTTLFGSIGSVILDVNYRMLSKATTELFVRFLLKEE